MPSATPLLRSLTPDDYEPLWRLFLIVFPIKYKNEFLDCWLARTPELSLGAFAADGELLGFVVTSPEGESAQQIEFLGVSPTAQKGGVGTLLLQRVLDACRAAQTRVTLIPVNEPRVIDWYKRHGFTECGTPRISAYTGDLEQTMELVPA